MVDGSNFLEMSDEDILNMSGPESPVPGREGDASPALIEVPASKAGTAPEGGAADPTGVDDGVAAGTVNHDPTQPITTEPVVTAPVADPVADPAVQPAVVDPAAPAEASNPVERIPTGDEAVAFYQQVMKPFKANGKMIELRSPDEAISLMQMGANYTRKMQELQPHRKTLLMLQNNNLLDADRLSFLIDLDKGDPEALKKFIKDRGIDPMDIDTTSDPAYLGGTHRVTDEEAVFRSALEDLRSTPEGAATLIEVNERWDTASKELLWKDPEILTAIQEQRESGVYDAIVAEMDRQRTLGKLSTSMPFIEAYRTVGDQLVAAYTQQDPAPANVAAAPAPVVLATRAAAPASPASNAAQVAAAAPSRGTATKAKDFVNPLAMSDDEFLAKMANRV